MVTNYTFLLCISTLSVGNDQPQTAVAVQTLKADAAACRRGAVAVHDASRDRVMILGGVEPKTREPILEISFYDQKDNRWGALRTTGEVPRACSLPGAAYVPGDDAVYYFGGWGRDAERPSNEFWRLKLNAGDAAKWEKLDREGAPPARNGLVLVHDAPRHRLILHGGDGGSHPVYGFTPLNDLWAFDLKADMWSKLAPSGKAPTRRWNHSGAVDAENERLYVFGGAGLPPADRSVYRLDLKALEWTQLSPPSGEDPPPMEGHSMTWDPRHQLLVVVGGLSIADSGPAGSRSIWLFDPKEGKWREHADKLSSTRRGHAAVFQPKLNRHLVVGGVQCTVRGNYYTADDPVMDAAAVTLTAR